MIRVVFAVVAIFGLVMIAPARVDADKDGEPKAAVEAYVASLNSGDVEAAAKLVAEDVVIEGEEPGRDAFKERSALQLEARKADYTEWHFELDRVIVSGDDVAARLILEVTLKNGKNATMECVMMATVEDGVFTWMATTVDAEDWFNVFMLEG